MAIFFVLAPVAFGQEPNPTPETVTEATPTPSQTTTAESERVIVTGSHIPTAEEVGPNPILEIDREQIDKAGERTAAELLRQLPIDSFAGVPTVNGGFDDTAGASSIALRGFDASSTLVLLNGRRLAPFPVGANPSGGVTFIDLNSIPKAAIESIEILKDSASSIYGADAVAGVVNIKLRQDYRDAEIATSYGNTLEGDTGVFDASAVFGVGDDKTDITGVISYYNRDGLFDRDRGFSRRPDDPEQFSNSASPANFKLSRAAILAAGVPPSEVPNPRSGIVNAHAPFFTDGNAPATDYVYGPSFSTYNVNLEAQAIPDSERYGGFLTADRKIFGDQLVAYSDFFYQNVDTFYLLTPTATGPFQVPGQTIAIPPHAPGPTVGGPSYADTGVPLGAYNPFNPFQQIISGSSQARLAEFGDRTSDNQTDAWFTTLGIKGDKLFDGNWGYDGGFRYSQVKNSKTFTGVSLSRFNRILNAADPIFDPTSSQYIGTTIPYNPFGDYRVPIPSNFESIDFASITAQETDISKLATLDLNIYTTSLFNLPAGGVGLAFGGQFRRESLKQKPDQTLLDGDVIGGSKSFFTAAGRKSYAFYAEARVPIVSSVNPLPGIRSLEFTGSARFEDYLDNNTNVLVPKVGVRWQPFDESLTLRATWSEGFHEPSLIELFGNPVSGLRTSIFNPIIDPVTHAPVPDFAFIQRSNPNLQPEDSRAFSGGFVYSPKFVPGLTLTVDLWDIESTGRAFIPDLQDVINRAAAGHLLPLESVRRDANGDIIFLEEAFQNAGSRRARGADFAIGYQRETSFGTFKSVTQATFLDSLKFKQTPESPTIELRNNATFLGSDTVPLEWKANSMLDWTWRNFSIGVTVHYLDGFHELVDRPPFSGQFVKHYVSQTWLFDLRASYTFGSNHSATAATASDEDGKSAPKSETVNYEPTIWRRLLNGTTVGVGCNNVFNHDPPQADTGVNYPRFLYDPTGRFVYVSVTKKF